MRKVILVRYGEIHLKGNNRGFFERMLLKNLKKACEPFGAQIFKIQGRYLVSDFNEFDEIELTEAISCVFGVTSLSVAFEVKTDVELIKDVCAKLDIGSAKTFKVETRRADKKFEINSTEFSAILGGVILKTHKVKVDVHNPDVLINVDIRENGFTYISEKNIIAVGGMPVGSAGKGLLLLSGGIDSPVAGYQMAKRGLQLDAIHFFSFPYTSELAKEKVITLAKKLTKYSGEINLHLVPFTEVQEHIHKYCRSEYMITLMRRIMMRIAERIARTNGCGTIITGESLGQVASQTMESITSTNIVVETLPIFRPLIAMDKIEIMDIARNIDTYNTSILPYEDCCTVFLPKNPIIKPKLDNVLKEEEKLNIEALITNALNNVEKLTL